MSNLLRFLQCARRISGLTNVLKYPARTSSFLLIQSPRVEHARFRCTVPNVQAKEPLNISLVNSAVNLLQTKINNCYGISSREINELLHKIPAVKDKLHSTHSALLLRCCGKFMIHYKAEDRMQLAENIWTYYKENDIPLETMHYNALLQVYLENECDFNPIELLAEMTVNDIKPNKLTFERLISYLCQKGDIKNTTEILKHMKELKFVLTEEIFISLINGHSISGDIESAKNMPHIMEDCGIVPSVDTYKSLMCAFARINDVDSINDLIKLCDKKNYALSNLDYLKIIYLLAVNNYDASIGDFLVRLNPVFSNEYDEVVIFTNLVKNGKEHVAQKILETLYNEESFSRYLTGNFVNILINYKSPESVIEICKNFKSPVFQRFAISKAIYTSYNGHDEKQILKLIRAYKEVGGEVRQHFFYPLLANQGQQFNFAGVLNVLSIMVREFDILPTAECLTSFVLPYFFGKLNEKQTTLLNLDIPKISVDNAIVYELLRSQKINSTLNYMKTHPNIYSYEFIRNVLFNSLIKRGEIDSFNTILKYLYSDLPYNFESMEFNTIKQLYKKISFDECMKDLSEFNTETNIEKLIQEIKEAKIQEEKEKKPQYQNKEIKRKFTEDEILNRIKQRELENRPTDKLKASLINIYIHKMDTKSLLSYIEKLKDENYLFLKQEAIFIFNYLCNQKCFDELKTFTDLPQIRNHLIQSFVKLLLSYNNAAGMYKIFNEKTEDLDEILKCMRNIYKYFIFGDKDNAGALAATYEMYKASDEFNVTNTKDDEFSCVLALAQGNIERAIELYKKNSSYTVKHLLTKYLIITENAADLQTVVNHSITTSNKIITATDLAFDFIECDREQEAIKILQSVEINFINKRIQFILEKYVANNNKKWLDSVRNIIRQIKSKNKDYFYKQYLNYCAKTNNWQEGLSILEEMKKEKIFIDDKFKHKLKTLLLKNNQPIPEFEFSELNKLNNEYSVSESGELSDSLQIAKRLLESLPPTHKDFVPSYSSLIKAYLSKDQLVEAAMLAQDCLFKNKDLYETQVFHELIDALQNNGDKDIIEKLKYNTCL